MKLEARTAAVALLALASCHLFEGGEPDPTPSERYARGLVDLGMADTALARAWLSARDRALEAPADLETPFHEIVHLDPAEPAALGYLVELRRGHSVLIDLTPEQPIDGRVFVDVFPPAGTGERTEGPSRPIAGGSLEGPFTFEVPRDGAYIVRIQPELLIGGRFSIVIEPGASLAFPVQGRGSDAIRSYFGDSRDQGRRSHEGVDIFAPRGTPAVAATDAYVTRVGRDGLGGLVVWLRDPQRNLRFYYAHLDAQLVATGDFVPAGTPVGLVGTTGNAASTPPHLHFGIYDARAIDPYPYLHTPEVLPAEVHADLRPIGGWARVAHRTARLRRGPRTGADVAQTLERQTTVRVIGAIDRWYRVRLPDGAAGYIYGPALEPAEAPLEDIALAEASLLRRRPDPTAPAIAAVEAPAKIPVLGRFGPYLLVAAPETRPAWLRVQ